MYEGLLDWYFGILVVDGVEGLGLVGICGLWYVDLVLG